MMVFINEEYGYRYWLWNTEMTEEQLIEWWRGLESTKGLFMSPKLFGCVKEVDAVLPPTYGYYLFLECDNDSCTHLAIRGKVYRHAGYKPEY